MNISESPRPSTADSPWDAVGYDDRFSYVSALGGDLLVLAAVRPGERVLDLGCGTGTLLAQLAEAGAEVSGCDADEAMIAQARVLAPGADLWVADGHSFTVDQPMDLVFSNAALHWMTRQDEVLGRVAAALRPGGRFVAEMGGAGNVATIIDAVMAESAERVRAVTNPWYFPTVGRQATALERAGFRVVQMEHFARPTPLIDCPDGPADWLRMFGDRLLAGFAPEEREAVTMAAARRCEPTLRTEQGWFADYWRLRFVAERITP